jgi:putative Flp pilus-assembly TadE/G-like protein
MLCFPPSARPARRAGKIVILLAVSLTAVFGIVALVLDGGLLQDNRRRVQAAADAAALAAATDLFMNWQQNAGYDPLGNAAKSAQATAAAYGYANDGTVSIVTVNIPPTSGDHAGQPGHAEVIIEYRQSRFFSSVFGGSNLPVRARAVARGRWTPLKDGIMVLDLSQSQALMSNGNGKVSVTNADVIVNSNDPAAVGGDGTGSVVQVVNGSFDLVGGVKANTTLQGPVTQLPAPVPDPLAYLPEPTLPTTALQVKGVQPTSPEVASYLAALNLQPQNVNGRVYVLQPGRYDKLPNFTNGDLVILQQASANSAGGVYYLNGSGFTANGATVVQDPTGGTTGGLMFFNNPSGTSGGISINGGTVKIDPPASGTYKGISFFQERSANVPFSIAGQGGTQVNGTFYVANGPISITGSSTTTLDVIGSQYISRTLQSGGNGNYTVNWQPDKTAPVRQFGLVE